MIGSIVMTSPFCEDGAVRGDVVVGDRRRLMDGVSDAVPAELGKDAEAGVPDLTLDGPPISLSSTPARATRSARASARSAVSTSSWACRVTVPTATVIAASAIYPLSSALTWSTSKVGRRV
jgi:hypothetical protein